MYDQVAAVDEAFRFPPDVRQAIVDSPELQAALAARDLANKYRYETFVRAIPEVYAGLDNTGSTDAAVALTALTAAMPVGGRLALQGEYRIDTTWSIPADKFLTLDFSNAQIITTGSHYTSIECIGTFDAQLPVSAMTNLSVVMDNKSRTVTRLTMTNPAPWKRGDIIKVIAEDIIPAAHITSDTMLPRVGEFAVVHDVSGNFVWLEGVLTEPIATNIRAARMKPGSVNMFDLRLDTSDSRLAAKATGPAVRLWNMRMPRVLRGDLGRLNATGFSFKSCLGYLCDSGSGLFGIDDTSTSNLGYFVQDSSCQDGMIIGGNYSGGRHAFTDGTGLTAANSDDTSSYGATINTTVFGVVSRNQKAACLDTHHMSRGVKFVFCTTYALEEESHYLLRGRDHQIINPVMYGGAECVKLICQESGTWSKGESWGHHMVGARAYDVQRVLTSALRTNGNHPYFGVRYTRRNISIEGGVYTGVRQIADIRNAIVEFYGGPSISYGDNSNVNAVYLDNAEYRFGDMRVDASAVTTLSGASARLIYDATATGSIIDGGRIIFIPSAAWIAGASRSIESASAAAQITILELIIRSAWTTVSQIQAPAGAWLAYSWRYERLNGSSSRYISVADGAITSSLHNVFGTTDPNGIVALSITDGTPRTLAILPPGRFIGQRKTFMGVGTTAITIQHGAGGNTSLAGGTPKVLDATGEAIELVYTGTTWRQLVAPA